MNIKFTRAPAIGRGHTSRPGPAVPLRGLVLAAAAVSAVVAGTAGTASAAVKAPVSPTLKAGAVAAVTASNPPVGSYTGTNPQNNEPITFYVSASKTSLQDISIPFVVLSCTPSGDANPTEPLGIAAIPLNSSGSFAATTTETGVYAGHRATFTYTFRGNYQGLNSSGVPTVSGAFKETMKFTDSTARTCTSGSQLWTAARDAQPPQTTSLPPVGSYTASNPQNNEPITFYVSASKTSLQDISIPFVFLSCTPSGDANPTQPMGIAAIPLKSNGSFAATTTQTGAYLGHRATFTYTFRGNYQGLNSSGVPTFSGTFKQTLTFTDSTKRTCTSGNQSWTATRDTQPPQTTTPPPVGSYTATNPQNNEPITFYVSASKTSLQDISIPYVYLNCSPPGDANPTQPLGIATIPLNSDGSFTATTTQTGVYAGYPAKFTYTFRGNYQGLNSSGVPTVTGTFKETLKYTGSAAETCTSGSQPWTATRDAQPPQTTTPPPAGSYKALNPQ